MKLLTTSICSLLLVCGCSNKPAKNLVSTETGFITVSQSMNTVGQVGESSVSAEPLSMGEGVLAFLPQTNSNFKPAINERWIEIDTVDEKISLMSGSKPLDVMSVTSSLTPGSYVVTNVKNKPVWYAPDSYFEQRKLSVPSADSEERFLRGALGEKAIYLNNGTVFHSARFENSEVAGIRLTNDLIHRLAEGAAKGTPIVVK